jgi:hypothetical protein
VTPEELERLLKSDAAGVRASRGFAARVMAAVRREPHAPPPIPFPWARAWPGLAVVVVAVAVAWFALPPDAASSGSASESAVAMTDWLAAAFAALDARWLLIASVVGALTVVPIVAPFWVVSYRRDS